MRSVFILFPNKEISHQCPQQIVIRVVKLNSATLTFEPQQTFKLNHTSTVLEFKQLLSETFNFDINQTLIVKYVLDPL